MADPGGGIVCAKTKIGEIAPPSKIAAAFILNADLNVRLHVVPIGNRFILLAAEMIVFLTLL